MLGTVKRLYKNFTTNKRINFERVYEMKLNTIAVNTKYRTPLTEEEKEIYKNFWGGVTNHILFDELEVFKYFNGFNVRFLGHNLYLPLIARKLNDYHYTKIFEDKNLIDRFSRVLKTPETVYMVIGGNYYDSNYKSIDKEQALELCREHKTPLIIKPSINSSGGKGVMRFFPKDVDTISFNCLPDNYIVQKTVEQHSKLSSFNSSSLNTFRITTLYLNGKFSICNIILRFGNNNSITDNFGSGGNLIGVNEEGALSKYAFNNDLEKFYSLNGMKFADIQLEFIPAIIALIKKAHVEDFSLCRYIGWDVAISANGEPVLIEVNSSQPGIFMEQIATGVSAFGGREEEVLEYINKKEFSYDL